MVTNIPIDEESMKMLILSGIAIAIERHSAASTFLLGNYQDAVVRPAGFLATATILLTILLRGKTPNDVRYPSG